MYFIFKILGGIAAFMIIAFYFINIGNNERKEKIENQRKMELSKTILGHVSNYTPNDVVNFISLDTFPTGSNVLQLNEEIDSRFIDSSKKFKVTNNSNFDVILISHDLINDKYNTSYFIKKKDTLTVQCLYFHLCFGNELGKFALKNENEDFRKALPRFKKPYQYTTNTIDDLLSVNGDLVLESKHDVVYIESKKPFNISSNDGLKMKITFK